MVNIQNPSSTYQTQQQIVQPLPQYAAMEQQQEHLKCPRCDSDNTKFCYYNNYNLSQPRHYCKSCRRYWTKGGALRNIPIGGGSRKSTKRTSNPKTKTSVSASASASTSVSNTVDSGFRPEHGSINGAPVHHVEDQCSMIDVNGSFSSLLAGYNQNESGIRTMQFGDFSEGLNSGIGLGLDMGRNLDLELDLETVNHSESFLGLHSGGDSSCWNNVGGDDDGGGDNGWPDLAI